ncbi:MAG: metal ABC transporter ATP-binding protein [Sedimentisphaerales bacterium]|nr:metal ABC transporter ATP-binding protein [Sedimentisphaerales bacterium]
MTRGCLSLSNVKVHRGARTILDVEAMEIREDEFVGIIGTNGAGKTTLLKVCCGLIGADSGTVRFDGRDFHQFSAWRKANLRRRIGYIPQAAEYNTELPFTLRELVAMGRTSVKGLLSRLNRKDYEIIDDWIDRLGLAEKRRQTFRSLSGGEQQKGLIARAMAQDPELLVLDEPCSNLDFNWKYQITELIDRLHRETDLTVLMVSHETSQLPPACGRVVLLHEGSVLADGDIEKILESDEFERAYKCRSETLKIAGRRYTFQKGSD